MKTIRLSDLELGYLRWSIDGDTTTLPPLGCRAEGGIVDPEFRQALQVKLAHASGESRLPKDKNDLWDSLMQGVGR